ARMTRPPTVLRKMPSIAFSNSVRYRSSLSASACFACLLSFDPDLLLPVSLIFFDNEDFREGDGLLFTASTCFFFMDFVPVLLFIAQLSQGQLRPTPIPAEAWLIMN